VVCGTLLLHHTLPAMAAAGSVAAPIGSQHHLTVAVKNEAVDAVNQRLLVSI
jgi:hypothetical protein